MKYRVFIILFLFNSGCGQNLIDSTQKDLRYFQEKMMEQYRLRTEEINAFHLKFDVYFESVDPEKYKSLNQKKQQILQLQNLDLQDSQKFIQFLQLQKEYLENLFQFFLVYESKIKSPNSLKKINEKAHFEVLYFMDKIILNEHQTYIYRQKYNNNYFKLNEHFNKKLVQLLLFKNVKKMEWSPIPEEDTQDFTRVFKNKYITKHFGRHL